VNKSLFLVIQCLILLLYSPITVQASPVQVDEQDFLLGIAELNLTIEDFESFPFGNQPAGSLMLSNGTYLSPLPGIFNGSGGSQVLIDNVSVIAPRSFTDFPVSTQFWGADFLVDPSAEFDVTVIGNSGSLTLVAERWNQFNNFIGFSDPLGLLSISVASVDFSNSGGGGKGIGNYAFDNVITAAGFTADFNGNGFVDEDDLVQWALSFGVDAGADTDADGDSDGADFLAWQQQFTGPGPLSAATSVPEPTGAALLLAALVCCGLLRSMPRLFRSIATLVIMASLLVAAESQAAVERYKIEADYLARLAELGHNTVVEGFEGTAWDGARSPDVFDRHSLPDVLNQGLLWEPASKDLFGAASSRVHGLTTNHNWARSGQWGIYEDHAGDLGYPTSIRVSSAALIYGVGGWFDTNPDGQSVGFLFENQTVANSPGYVLAGLGAMYPGDNPSFGHEFVGIVDPDGFSSVVLTGTLQINEEGVLEGGTIYGADDFTVALDSFASADFNTDTFIDGNDLLLWESSFAVDAGADADADGDTDGSDFLAWQQQFTSPGPLSAASAVSEPTTLLLLGLALLCGLSRRSIRTTH